MERIRRWLTHRLVPARPAALPVAAAPAGTEANPAPAAPPRNRRDKLLHGLDLRHGVGAEIGPLHNPLVAKSEGHVIYIDHCDTEALRRKWSVDPKVDLQKLHVDAVWGEQTLAQAVAAYVQTAQADDAARGLDYVVASHVIEHVPDMVSWLQEIEAVLKPDGQVRLAIPDKRFTFDFLRRTSTLADVLESYLRRARVPTPHCLLDFTLHMATVDCTQAWRGEIDRASLPRLYTFESSMGIAYDALHNGNYHDVHCWSFTPASFGELCETLAAQELLGFECAEFHDTARNEFEFIVALRRCADTARKRESWRRVAAAARPHPVQG